MKYTQIPTDTFKTIQLNAGVLADTFDIQTKEFDNIIGATSGGVTFTTDPEYIDFGEDIDNCPKNTMELKRIKSWSPKLSGTFLTLKPETAKRLLGAADMEGKHIIPRNKIMTTDFKDVWWIGDYSDVNDGENAGFIAIHVMNALNIGGFQLASTNDGKGNDTFEFVGHYSIENIDKIPFEIYIQEGTEA